MHLPGALCAHSHLGYAGSPGAALGKTLPQAMPLGPVSRIQQGVDTLSFQVVLTDAKKVGGGEIALNDCALEIDDEIGERRVIVESPVQMEIFREYPFMIGNFLVLQVEFHLMNLQFMEQLESISCVVGIT
jgi:hypothetical protein